MTHQNEHSMSRKPWQRGLVWTLIAALANPAFTLPMAMYSTSASARDTDIYLSAENAGTTAETAIMLILDTSDSMNTPEPWREYPEDEYDSHVEYLWNDVSTGDWSSSGRSIYNIGCTKGRNSPSPAIACTDESDANNDTPPSEGTPHLPMGYFAPAQKYTDSDITNLQTAVNLADGVKTAAISTETSSKPLAESAVALALSVCPGDSNLETAQSEIQASTLTPHVNHVASVIDAMNNALASCTYDDDSNPATSEVPRPEVTAAGTPVNTWASHFYAAEDAIDTWSAAVTAFNDAGSSNTQAKADRKSMKKGAEWYAKLSETLDPGPRYVYRNYGNNGNWVWWVPSDSALWNLPSGASSIAENDKRLRSNAFNRFAVGSRVSAFGSTNGGNNPVTRAGTNYGNIDDFSNSNKNATTRKLQEGNYNKCVSSMNEIMPSTVFAPGPYPRNSGKWEGQRWMRYDRFRGLDSSFSTAASINSSNGVDVYPPASPITVTPPVSSLSSSYPGVVANLTTGLSGGANPQGRVGVTRSPSANPPASSTDMNFGNQVMDNFLQPIRKAKADSYAGWADVRADMGGYNFMGYVNGMNYSATAGSGSLNEVLSYYLDSGATTCNSTATCRYTAWKGNRDGYYAGNGAGGAGSAVSGVNIGNSTGTRAYYDVAGTVAHNSTSGTSACTRICTSTALPSQNERDFGANTTALDATFASGNSGTNLYAYDSCTQPSTNGWKDGSTVVSTLPGTCSAAACSFSNSANFNRLNNFGCAWTNRLSKYVEGKGTLYYGGTCSGTTKGELNLVKGETPALANGTASCEQPTSGNTATANWVGSYTIDGVLYTNVTQGIAGTCADKSDTTQNCGTRNNPTACTYSTNATASGGTSTSTYACPDRTGTYGGSTISYTYGVYNRNGNDDYMIHDCVADNGKAADSMVSLYNPGGSYLNEVPRTFNVGWNSNTTNSPSTGTLSTSTTNTSAWAASYSNASHAVEDDNDKHINTYSTNYLNWKFGAKICRSGGKNGPIITSGAMPADAVCRPIGRKTRLQIAKDALNNLIDDAHGMRFGLTVFNKLPHDNDQNAMNGSQGANVVFPISPMGSETSPNTANREQLKNIINWLEAKGATPLTEATYEAYRYFRGEAPYFGTNAAISANSGATAVTAVGGVGGVADGAAAQLASTDDLYKATWDGTKYKSPMLSNPDASSPAKCQKNYVLLISDGGPEKDGSADTLVQSLTQGPPYLVSTNAAAQSTTTTQFEKASGVPYGPADRAFPSNYAWLDELTYFMAHGDMSPGGGSGADAITSVQAVGTYAIGFAGGSSEVLKHAAACGQIGRPGDGCGSMGSQYYDANDAKELGDALRSVLASIRDWNATTSAPTVPISAYNRSESADDVFLAFFGPKQSQGWDGTVKKFKISTKADECGKKPAANPATSKDIPLCLTGQGSNLSHISLVSGGYTSSVKNVELYQERLNPDGLTGNGEFDVKVNENAWSMWSAEADGGKAFKGGTGYVLTTTITSPASRKVYTHLDTSSEVDLTDAANEFSTDNASVMTAAVLGTADTTEQSKRVNYARGADPTICNSASSACNDASYWRAWPAHDVLHSRPIVVPYQKPILIPDADPLVDADGDGNVSNDISYTTPVQYMYFMSNDGLMHAVDTVTGEEKWAFLAPESMSSLGALITNATGEHITAGDGTPSLYLEDRSSVGNATPNGIIDVSEGDKAYLIFGLRRGGRAYYALDITAKDTPKFLWKLTPTQHCQGSSACVSADASLAEMGETWSMPAISKMKITAPTAVTDPVAAFAGGYDPRPNDWIVVSTITSAAGVATVTTPVDHLYATGDHIKVRGAETTDGNNAYNVNSAVITVTGPRSFTYTVSGTPPSPATAAVKRIGGVAQPQRKRLEVISVDSAKEGRGVFFVNARTGELIRSFTHSNYTTAAANGSHTINYSMPTDVALLNTDLDATGYADRMYVGDMGGNIWRFNIGSADSSTWTAYKFADLSGGTGNRKIFFPPAVLRNSQKGYHGVYVGTGDRENPLRTDQQDKFFMIKDKSVGLGTAYPAPIVYSTTVFKDVTNTPVISGLVDANSNGSNDDEEAAFLADLDTKSGWSMDFVVGESEAFDGEHGGEKAINAPTVFFNIVRFGTYSPVSQPSPCLPPGQGLIYAMNALTGEATDINLNKTIDSGDTRVINDFTIRGFASSGTMIIRDGKIWHLTVADGALKAENIGTAGVGRFTYWYQEPEQ